MLSEFYIKMAAIQKVIPCTNIALPLESPCKYEDFNCFYDEMSIISNCFVLKIFKKTFSFPNDLTVLILQTVSLINDPTYF
jgi:hypothetical protein